MKIEIRLRYDGSVLHSGEYETLRRAVEAAVKQGANLVGADLQGADLRSAQIRRARLANANLRGANLRNANMQEADLLNADLSGADLHGADLYRANIVSADLRGANLGSTDLRNAESAREDVRRLISDAPTEALGLLLALRAGKVDGSCYEGACACLCGTIAQVRAGKVLLYYGDVMEILDSAPLADSSRPAEQWALVINEGDTPQKSPVVALTVQWIEEWLAEQAVRT
jgi:hypothetical protein